MDIDDQTKAIPITTVRRSGRLSMIPRTITEWRAFAQRWRIIDWIVLVILGVASYLLHMLQPFNRMFSLDDPRIQFPHALTERVNNVQLFMYALVIPLGVVAGWTIITRSKIQKIHIAILGLVTSVLLASVITGFFKNVVGRPRPDLLARCQPAPGTPTNVLVGKEVCTAPPGYTLSDGWRSFPSGHSSTSFAGLGYLSLFIGSQLHFLRARVNSLIIVLTVAPLVAAAMIAISRLEDYRHDYADVFIGSLLGLATAYGTWHRFWPPLNSPYCDQPFSYDTHDEVHALPSIIGGPDRDHDQHDEHHDSRGLMEASRNSRDVEMGLQYPNAASSSRL